ncbi:CCC motif membrane protein [Leeuwenhoekiella sp. H156]|uniref:CCC motif membrane protein n=1 Tax=Leeuwenhoekiella sp. H156 TaxID=3450128 RepID=UPI003FA43929
MEQQRLNTTLVYVLAILALLCCCFGGSGFILAGIAFYIAHTKLKEAKIYPENYDLQNVKAMNTAKTIAFIILIINILYLIYTIYKISTIGWETIWEDAMRQAEEMQASQQS